MSGNLDDRFDNDPRLDSERIREVKGKVTFPATLLIVVGALSALYAILQIIQLPSFPATMDQAIAIIDADPNMPRDQKDKIIDIYTTAKDFSQHPGTLVYLIVNVVCGIAIAFGGIKMLQLSGPATPIIAATLAAIPGPTGCCCCIFGLPAGIWALVVLNQPSVRAAMAIRKSSTNDLDDRDTREV